MFIDIHSHCYKKPYHFPFLPPFCSPRELIAEYDALGIDKAVLMPVVSPDCYIPQTNEEILEICAEYPDRFIPFCNIDPRALTNDHNAPLDVVLQYYKDLGCKGVGEVMPNLELMDPRVQNLFACAEKVGLPITYDGSTMKTGDFGLYDDPGLPQLEATLIKYPNLTVFGHGPVFWAEIARLETPAERGTVKLDNGSFGIRMNKGPIKEEGVVPKLLRKYSNLMLDLSDGCCYAQLTRDEEFIWKFIEEFGDRMCFGTDYVEVGMPVKLVETLKRWHRDGKISDHHFKGITHENAIRILNL